MFPIDSDIFDQPEWQVSPAKYDEVKGQLIIELPKDQFFNLADCWLDIRLPLFPHMMVYSGDGQVVTHGTSENYQPAGDRTNLRDIDDWFRQMKGILNLPSQWRIVINTKLSRALTIKLHWPKYYHKVEKGPEMMAAYQDGFNTLVRFTDSQGIRRRMHLDASINILGRC